MSKHTDHIFESGSDEIEITEFPFYPGEKTHLRYKPYSGYISDFTVMGNPEKEQTLFLGNDDTLFWVTGNVNFVTQLEEAIEKWRRQWDLNKPISVPEQPYSMTANPWNIAKLLSEITCMGCDEAHDVVMGIMTKYANEKGRVFLSKKAELALDEVEDKENYDTSEQSNTGENDE